MTYETLVIGEDNGRSELTLYSPDYDDDFEVRIDYKDNQGAYYKFFSKEEAKQVIEFLQRYLDDDQLAREIAYKKCVKEAIDNYTMFTEAKYPRKGCAWS